MEEAPRLLPRRRPGAFHRVHDRRQSPYERGQGMRPHTVLTHEFVEYVPENLEERTLYVSVKFKTVLHKCCCGCGREVVTPLSPTGWKLTFDGETISLRPSIGSWNLPCQSHYWIEDNTARW